MILKVKLETNLSCKWRHETKTIYLQNIHVYNEATIKGGDLYMYNDIVS